MDCPNCSKPVRCIDSRKKLSYVPDIRGNEEVPARERKYACFKCDLVIITRERIFSTYPGQGIKDKRISKAKVKLKKVKKIKKKKK